MRGFKPFLFLFLLVLGGLAACASDAPTGIHSEKEPALDIIEGADQGGRPIFAHMTGPQEVPPGDPDGTGTARFTLNQGQGQVCYEVTVANIALPATASHVHRGVAGVAGPPVVFLAAPVNGTASGCVAVARETIKAIRQNPSAYYVNVHNGEYPSGAVRGQLQR